MTGQGGAEPRAVARRLVRVVPKAALGTVLRGSNGWPYVALVSVATDHDGSPPRLLSDLADHAERPRDHRTGAS